MHQLPAGSSYARGRGRVAFISAFVCSCIQVCGSSVSICIISLPSVFALALWDCALSQFLSTLCAWWLCGWMPSREAFIYCTSAPVCSWLLCILLVFASLLDCPHQWTNTCTVESLGLLHKEINFQCHKNYVKWQYLMVKLPCEILRLSL